jgi:hypothetical protein
MIIAYGRGKMSSFIKKYPELFKRVSEYNVREASGAQKYLCNLPPPCINCSFRPAHDLQGMSRLDLFPANKNFFPSATPNTGHFRKNQLTCTIIFYDLVKTRPVV